MDERLHAATTVYAALIAREPDPLALDADQLDARAQLAWRAAETLLAQRFDRTPAFVQEMPAVDA